MNNLKTDEIVKALRMCADDQCSKHCMFRVDMANEVDCISRMARVAVDLIEAMQQEQRWIPVTERLPETGITVLTLDKRGHMRDRALHTFRGGQRLFRPDGLAPGYDILYWMPLPEAPKE